MPYRSFATALFAIAVSLALPALAQSPMRVEASSPAPDGKLLFAGDSHADGGPARIAVGRVNADGSFDQGFGESGIVQFSPAFPAPSDLHAVAVTTQGDGKVVVAAVADGLVALIHLDALGNPDPSFGVAGYALDMDSAGEVVHAVLSLPTGEIVTAGSYSGTDTGGYHDVQLVHYGTNGAREWVGGGPRGSQLYAMSSGDNEALAGALMDDASIVIAGYVQDLGGAKNFMVAKFWPDGTPNNSFGTDGKAVVVAGFDQTANAVAIQGSRIVAAGRNSHTIGGAPASFLVAERFDALYGYPDFTFNFGQVLATLVLDFNNNPVDFAASSIAVVDDDTFIVGATTRGTWPGAGYDFGIASINSFGARTRVAPTTATDETLTGVIAGSGWILGIGTRTDASGANGLVRARYFLDDLQFDTDFPNPGADSDPNPFSFGGAFGLDPAVVAVSDSTRITGIDVAAPIAIQNGEYSVGCDGTFTSAPGTIEDGQYVCVRTVSATTPNTLSSATLTVGSVQGNFDTWTGSPPNGTTISAMPVSAQAHPRFQFFGFGGTSFDCNLDGAAFARCASPYVMDGWNLSAGTHTFVVRTVNGWGADPVPASYTWSFVPPDTSIFSGPPALTSQRTASFQFSGNGNLSPGDTGGITFQCSLDGAAFATCSSPVSLGSLADGQHAFQVRIVLGTGNPDPTPASWTWRVDGTAPAASITSSLGSPVASRSAAFQFVSDDPQATFECLLDGGAVTACSSPAVYNGLAEGSHAFSVRAVDAAGNRSAWASQSWIVDVTAPETTLAASGPSGTVASTTAHFTITTESGATLQCSLDGGPWTACAGSVDYAGLADGSHLFQARAVDAAGNVDATPASRAWTIDSTAPDTSLVSAPAGTVASSSATLQFTATESGATFQCSLDGAAFSACASPVSLSGLADGSHAFQVRAVDAAGNVDATPASAAWIVDTTAPETSITAGPSGTVAVASATFIFTSPDGTATFECSLDAGSWTPCSSPLSYTALADATHMFEVRARDATGNVDPSPDSRTWTVDTSAPNTTITSGPDAITSQTGATFQFTATEGATFFCAIDGAPFTACTSPASYTALAGGGHSFAVYSVDGAGNVDPSPATWSWAVDVTAPDTTITSMPPAVTNSTSASFVFSATEGATFECSIDAAAFAACASPAAYGSLVQGSHTFQVRARDAVGNLDPTPASFTWIVDTTPPDTTITGGPSGNNNPSTATFTFTSNEAGATFQCKLDTGSFSACSTPKTYTGLARGSHSFQVRAVDAAGNTDATPATRSWNSK